MDLTDDERKFIGFHLAARLEDYEKELRKHGNPPTGMDQLHKLEQLVYTKIIPESWSGPKPTYWKV